MHPVHIGIEIEKILWGLHKCDMVIYKVTQSPGNKILLWRMIRVKDCDELTRTFRQGVIQVAGFGVNIFRARDITDSQSLGQLLYFDTVAVIQYPGLMRIVHVHCGHGSPPDQIHRLVIGGNKHVYRFPVRRRGSLPDCQAPGSKYIQQGADETVDLCGIQGVAE